MTMKHEEHLIKLGKIIMNLLGLEFMLRSYLLKINEAKEPSVDIDIISLGEKVPVNSLTNYDTLGEVIEKFNKKIILKDPSLKINTDVVNIRDIIAHGRVFGRTQNPPFRIFKFGKPIKPEKNTVKVEEIIEADSKWFHSTITFTYEQFQIGKKAWEMLNVI